MRAKCRQWAWSTTMQNSGNAQTLSRAGLLFVQLRSTSLKSPGGWVSKNMKWTLARRKDSTHLLYEYTTSKIYNLYFLSFSIAVFSYFNVFGASTQKVWNTTTSFWGAWYLSKSLQGGDGLSQFNTDTGSIAILNYWYHFRFKTGTTLVDLK